MKCASELELEAVIREDAAAGRNEPSHRRPLARGLDEPGGGRASPGRLPSTGFGAQNTMDGSSDDDVWWSGSIRTPQPASSSTTVEWQRASVSAVSSRGTSSNHRHESQSDSDGESLFDVERVPCVRGTKSLETKRIRRMVSNRKSARRSRRRKQAQLAEVESQVEQLKGENATIFKKLAEANQQFTTAVTDNRILKSDLEALRVKVKMAEDMVARGAMSCGLGDLGLAPLLNSRKMRQALDMLTVTGLDLLGRDTCFRGPTTAQQVQNSPVQSTASLESLDN